VLMDGDAPARLSHAAIEFIRENIFLQLSERPKFLPGQLVVPSEGTFAGFPGEFVRMRDDERCVVLFGMLGRPVVATLRADQLESLC
jgi:transcription antitermination factor NusG